MSDPLVFPSLGDPVDELWELFVDLGERLEIPWSIIGGQMVLLHALEHETVPPQVSQDGDVIANVRAAPQALRRMVAVLGELGLTLEGMSTGGIAHRYQRSGRSVGRPVVIDLLGPDGVGKRADLTTTPPGRTLQAPGGTQALKRTERVLIQVGRRIGEVPRPSLLAAVVGKARACGLPEDPARHLRDLALLCALIDDPFSMGGDLTASDRRGLRFAAALDETTHPAWMLVPENLRSDGRTGWRILNREQAPRR